MTPEKVWKEYQRIQEYCREKNLYETVKTNENFYDGRQWEGVKADNLPKPVINILQRVVKYMIATLSSNDVAVSINPLSDVEDDAKRLKIVSNEIEKVIEQARIKEASKLMIRNGAVDGSAYMMQIFDPDFETGQAMKGAIENLLIDNTQVYFGNPYSNNVQKQPFIIIALRQYIDQVKLEAKNLGVSQEDIDSISPDNDTEQANDDSNRLVTVLLRFEKREHVINSMVVQNGMPIEVSKKVKTVFFTKSTRNVMLKDETDLGYQRYPIACFGWDGIKNSYLYNSPITYVIPNQIFINKCYAIAQMYGMQSAFPKIVYDRNKIDIDDLMDNASPSGMANIDMLGKVLDFIKVPDFSNNILNLLDNIIAQTKECMGVNDASLGNVKPDNTSAIVALQEASNVPLEIQRQSFFHMWEDTIRNILDIMVTDYGVRKTITEDGELAEVDYSLLRNINYDLNIDIGTGAQFSEIAQIQTLDKLFQAQIIDAKTYIDAIPTKYIPIKNKILAELEEREQMQEQQMQEQMMQPQAMNVADQIQ